MKSLCLDVVDDEKTFDSIEYSAVFNSLQQLGINKRQKY